MTNREQVYASNGRLVALATIAIVVIAVAKAVSLFLPVFSASGEVLDVDLWVLDLAPVAIGVGLSVVVDLLAAWLLSRQRVAVVWVAFALAAIGALIFAVGEFAGEFLGQLASIGPVNEYQDAEIGIGVTVLMVLYIIDLVLLPLAAVLFLTGRRRSSVTPDERPAIESSVESWDSSFGAAPSGPPAFGAGPPAFGAGPPAFGAAPPAIASAPVSPSPISARPSSGGSLFGAPAGAGHAPAAAVPADNGRPDPAGGAPNREWGSR